MSSLLRSLRHVRRLKIHGRRLGGTSSTTSSATTLLATSTCLDASSRCLAAIARPLPQCLNSLLLGGDDRRCNYVTNAATKLRYGAANTGNVDLMLNELDRKIRMHGNLFRSDVEEILEAVLERNTMTSTQALLLIRCCGEFMSSESRGKRQELVKYVWDMIRSLDVPVDVSHYNSLLLVHLENEKEFSPLEILVEMKNKGIEPNRVTFQRLIEQYCTKGDIAGATKILEHMSKYDLPLNEIIFNSLIRGHSEAGDVESAVKVVDVMKQAGTQPTQRTYSVLMCAHAKSGNMGAIRKILQECKMQDVQLSDQDVLNVIYALAINNQAEHIDEMMSCLPKGRYYNREVVTTVGKLVEKDQLDVAYRLVKSMTNREEEAGNSGSFFIKKMLNENVNPDRIAHFIRQLEEDNLNRAGWRIALFKALKDGQTHLAMPLLKSWKESGGEIREHFFFPIFVAFGKASNLQGIFNTLAAMMYDFNMTPRIMTLKHYVVPYMTEDPMRNAMTLNNNNVPFSTAANAVMLDLLLDNKTHPAAKFINGTSITLRKSLIINPLAAALLATGDVKSVVEILHHQYVCMLEQERSREAAQQLQQQLQQQDEDNTEDEPREDEMNTAKQFASALLTKVATKKSCQLSLLTDLVQELLNKGLSIDLKAADAVRAKFADAITPELETMLTSLLSEELAPAPLALTRIPSMQTTNYRTKRIEELEKADDSPESKMMLLQHHAKLKNHAAIEKLLKELEESNAQLTVGFCASMMDYFAQESNVEAADKWCKRLFEINPNAGIDKVKILNYASALVKEKRVSEALEALRLRVNDLDAERSFKCERFMNDVYQNCPERVDEFLELLMSNKFVLEPSNSLLGPAVKVHMDAGDFDKAIDKLQSICETYRLTPQKSVLMMKLIEAENAAALQRVTDILTQAHGEMNALFDLAVAFVDCDRPRQARKILETPGLRVSRMRVQVLCKLYNSRPEKLEGLIQLLQGLFYDMDTIYLELLKAYNARGEWSKCLALWTQMQEDNVQPSPLFMMSLEKILRENDQNVPFARTGTAGQQEQIDDEFKALMEAKSFQEAEALLGGLPQGERAAYYARLADAYVNEQDQARAREVARIFLKDHVHQLEQHRDAMDNVFRFLAQNDDFENIKELVSQFAKNSANDRKRISFGQAITEGYASSGKFSQYIDYISGMLTDVNSERSVLHNFLHPFSMMKAIITQPELLDKFEKFANAAAEVNVRSPINAVWMYHFLRDDPQAERMWSEQLRDSPGFYHYSVIHACEFGGSLDKLPRVAEKLHEATRLRTEEKRRGYSLMFRVLFESDEPKKYEIAYECMRHAVKALPYHSISDNTISTIEKNLPSGKTVKALKEESGGGSDSVKEEATG